MPVQLSARWGVSTVPETLLIAEGEVVLGYRGVLDPKARGTLRGVIGQVANVYKR
jgi:hypothetical protein